MPDDNDDKKDDLDLEDSEQGANDSGQPAAAEPDSAKLDRQRTETKSLLTSQLPGAYQPPEVPSFDISEVQAYDNQLKSFQGDKDAPYRGFELDRAALGTPMLKRWDDELKRSIDLNDELKQSIGLTNEKEEEICNRAVTAYKFENHGDRKLIDEILAQNKHNHVAAVKTIRNKYSRMYGVLKPFLNGQFRKWYESKFASSAQRADKRRALFSKLFEEQDRQRQEIRQTPLVKEVTKHLKYLMLRYFSDKEGRSIGPEIDVKFYSCVNTVIDDFFGTDGVFTVDIANQPRRYVQIDLTKGSIKTNDMFRDVVIIQMDHPTPLDTTNAAGGLTTLNYGENEQSLLIKCFNGNQYPSLRKNRIATSKFEHLGLMIAQNIVNELRRAGDADVRGEKVHRVA